MRGEGRQPWKNVFLAVFPWALAILIGVLTALTGFLIGVTSDYLSDIRFGYCSGNPLASRITCCHEWMATHYGFVELGPCAAKKDGQEWVPWPQLLGMDFSHYGTWTRSTLSVLIYTTFSALMAGISAALVCSFCPDARGGGVAEVKAAVSGFDLPRSLSAWCLLVKSLGFVLAIGAGLEIVADDPLVSIAACWAQVVQRVAAFPLRLLRLSVAAVMPLHEVACVGVATGVATAFGTPLGGVLFAIEELSSVRPLGHRALLLAFTSAAVASFVQHSMLGSGHVGAGLPVIEVAAFGPAQWLPWEIKNFLFAGVLGGCGGALFVRISRLVIGCRQAHVRRSELWLLPSCLRQWLCCGCFSGLGGARCATPVALNVLECMLIAWFTSLVNYQLTPLLRNSPVQSIRALVSQCPSRLPQSFELCNTGDQQEFPNVSIGGHATLLLAAVVRAIEAACIFGAAVPSGVWMPSLFIGAALGRLIGNIVFLSAATQSGSLNGDSMLQYIEPGHFAAVGAVAMLAGFRRMTVSLVVIVFEMTGENSYIVPYMCAALTAKLVGDVLSPSIYESHAQMCGYPMITSQADVRLNVWAADLAETLTADDLIDVSLGHVSLPRLLSSSGMQQPREQQGDGRVVGTPSPSSVLLVHRGSASSAQSILGVVRKSELRDWLAMRDLASISICALSAETPGGRPAFSTLSVEGGEAVSSWHTNAVDNGGGLLDATCCVDESCGMLTADAPLLTAYCIFTQNVELQFCVCVGDAEGSLPSVLSRQAFFAALSDGRFPLARWVDPERNSMKCLKLVNESQKCETSLVEALSTSGGATDEVWSIWSDGVPLPGQGAAQSRHLIENASAAADDGSGIGVDEGWHIGNADGLALEHVFDNPCEVELSDFVASAQRH
eukprot:TRINITY_DN32872_c0_g1_i1.p1 TRINITY_DN32872_c0_g1~~TRINITY_DN32872_c0_g1_i1.p1  ORF type:complete len:894 (-),score=141.47 TRINITY_DN32872_c0_g1_i1:65-2746(-)